MSRFRVRDRLFKLSRLIARSHSRASIPYGEMKCSSASYVSLAFLVLIGSRETMATVLYKPEVVQVETCGANEVYSSCGGHPECEKNCVNIDTWDSVGCTFRRDCIAGCVCGEGFARDANRVCVWANKCPRVRH